MMDQCYHCELRGNYESCKAAECGKHEDWITLEHKKRIRDLQAQLAAKDAEVELLSASNKAMTETLMEVAPENKALREGLRRLHYELRTDSLNHWRLVCRGCGEAVRLESASDKAIPQCPPDCWLAALLESK